MRTHISHGVVAVAVATSHVLYTRATVCEYLLRVARKATESRQLGDLGIIFQACMPAVLVAGPFKKWIPR